jgi:tetratricopeptide (TPR) repeat protein
LGVRYVLEGSVRRSGSQLRVSAQLIDAATDAHLWAERFDSDTGNLITLQNEITSRIAVALNIELTNREAARPTEHPDALDYILRGRAAYWKPNSREKWAETISLFERALTLDPQSVEAQSWLAAALAFRVANGYAHSATLEIQRAEELVGKALAASPRYWFAHYAKGSLRRVVQYRCDEAIPEYEIALALNPYWMNTLVGLGSCKLLTGSIEEVIPLSEQAIRLSPRDPFIGIPFFQIGQVHLLQSRTDEAIVWFERARSAFPGYPVPHAWLSSAYALKGETARAAAELEEARTEGRREWGESAYLSIAHLRGVEDFGVPKVRALFETTYIAGLRKAGMPE